MLISDITEEQLSKPRMVWRRMGKTIKRVRCTSGRRKGRVVSKSAMYSIYQYEKTYGTKKNKSKNG